MRVLRSKPSSAISPCALVGEREGVGEGVCARKGGVKGWGRWPDAGVPLLGCLEVGASDCNQPVGWRPRSVLTGTVGWWAPWGHSHR